MPQIYDWTPAKLHRLEELWNEREGEGYKYTTASLARATISLNGA